MSETPISPSSNALSAECPDCGLTQRIVETLLPANSYCVRCGRILRRHGPEVPARAAAAGALVALALLLVGYSLPIMSVRSGERYTEAVLATGPELLLRTGEWALALAIVTTLFFAPILQLLLLIVTALERPSSRTPGSSHVKWLPLVSRWSMLEIFLLGVLVTWTRLNQWLHVMALPALIALAAAAAVIQVANRTLASKRLVHETPASTNGDRNRPTRAGLTSSAALTIAGYLLYVPANLLPIMTAHRLTEGGPTTILGGVRELIRDGSWVLAIVVFLASVAVPLLKLLVLSILLLMTLGRSPLGLRTRTRMFRLIAAIGRWSMLDIFVLSLLVGLVRLGVLGYVRPEPGALAFCAVVIVTMLATEVFDPRSMWDAAGRNDSETRVRAGVTT